MEVEREGGGRTGRRLVTSSMVNALPSLLGSDMVADTYPATAGRGAVEIDGIKDSMKSMRLQSTYISNIGLLERLATNKKGQTKAGLQAEVQQEPKRMASMEVGEIYRTASALSIYLDDLETRPQIDRLMSMPSLSDPQRIMDANSHITNVKVTITFLEHSAVSGVQHM